jgi:hypothetical protein
MKWAPISQDSLLGLKNPFIYNETPTQLHRHYSQTRLSSFQFFLASKMSVVANEKDPKMKPTFKLLLSGGFRAANL